MSVSDLVARYDVPVPRYTSYPPVPHWRDTPSPEQWLASVSSALDAPQASLALYLHLPFCESLCTFCGCNTVITRDHRHEATYVDALFAELDLYVERVPGIDRRSLSQLHLGGGTPTFMSADSLDRLMTGLETRLGRRATEFEGSIEVDPRVTTWAQLEVMRRHGVTRVSLGVQDVDPEVQRLVNRRQPLTQTDAICRAARALGYESLNFDLIYGLPGQTIASMARLTEAVLDLRPDRLAVYSFARVPWIKPAQRRFKDDQIPAGADKRALYEAVRDPLLDAGYEEIGLDHFALPADVLARAARHGTLHRNFMGYTHARTSALLGLGVSAISETAGCYHQNEKVLTKYARRVQDGEIPTLRGHVLSGSDRDRRGRILELMTRFAVEVEADEAEQLRQFLGPLFDEGLLTLDEAHLIVPPQGRPFLRHAASFFDLYYRSATPDGPRYSTSA